MNATTWHPLLFYSTKGSNSLVGRIKMLSSSLLRCIDFILLTVAMATPGVAAPSMGAFHFACSGCTRSQSIGFIPSSCSGTRHWAWTQRWGSELEIVELWPNQCFIETDFLPLPTSSLAVSTGEVLLRPDGFLTDGSLRQDKPPAVGSGQRVREERNETWTEGCGRERGRESTASIRQTQKCDIPGSFAMRILSCLEENPEKKDFFICLFICFFFFWPLKCKLQCWCHCDSSTQLFDL